MRTTIQALPLNPRVDARALMAALYGQDALVDPAAAMQSVSGAPPASGSARGTIAAAMMPTVAPASASGTMQAVATPQDTPAAGTSVSEDTTPGVTASAMQRVKGPGTIAEAMQTGRETLDEARQKGVGAVAYVPEEPKLKLPDNDIYAGLYGASACYPTGAKLRSGIHD